MSVLLHLVRFFSIIFSTSFHNYSLNCLLIHITTLLIIIFHYYFYLRSYGVLAASQSLTFGYLVYFTPLCSTQHISLSKKLS